MLAALLLVLTTLSLVAQVTSGIIEVRITDANQGPINQCKVSAVDVGTNAHFEVDSDVSGLAVFPSVPAGTYRLTVDKAGFRAYSVDNVTVRLAQTFTIPVTLEIGSVAQSVTVSASEVQVNVANAQLSAAISRVQLDELPLAGNRYLTAVAFSPGMLPMKQTYLVAQNVNVTLYSGQMGAQAAGARQDETDYQIDSSHVRSTRFGTPPNLPSSQAIQDVQIIRNNFSAEFGLTSTVVIAAASRSGGNTFHGSLYETLGNDALNSRAFFDSVKPPLRYNQFGANLGGPVRIPWLYNGTDRTFFFFGVEGIKIPNSSTFVGGIPLSAAQQQGDFSSTATQITDPTTGQPFPNNKIPESRLDPVARFVASRMPQPNLGIRTRFTLPADNNSWQYNTRLDHAFTSKLRVFGRFYRDTPSARTNRTSLDELQLLPDANYNQRALSRTFSGNVVYMVSSRIVNQTNVIQDELSTFGDPLNSSTLDWEKIGIHGIDTTGRRQQSPAST